MPLLHYPLGPGWAAFGAPTVNQFTLGSFWLINRILLLAPTVRLRLLAGQDGHRGRSEGRKGRSPQDGDPAVL